MTQCYKAESSQYMENTILCTSDCNGRRITTYQLKFKTPPTPNKQAFCDDLQIFSKMCSKHLNEKTFYTQILDVRESDIIPLNWVMDIVKVLKPLHQIFRSTLIATIILVPKTSLSQFVDEMVQTYYYPTRPLKIIKASKHTNYNDEIGSFIGLHIGMDSLAELEKQREIALNTHVAES